MTVWFLFFRGLIGLDLNERQVGRENHRTFVGLVIMVEYDVFLNQLCQILTEYVHEPTWSILSNDRTFIYWELT